MRLVPIVLFAMGFFLNIFFVNYIFGQQITIDEDISHGKVVAETPRYNIQLAMVMEYDEAVNLATEASKKLGIEFFNNLKYGEEAGLASAYEKILKSEKPLIYLEHFHGKRSDNFTVHIGYYDEESAAENMLIKVKKFYKKAHTYTSYNHNFILDILRKIDENKDK